MKKLLSVFAAAAMLFGFASCSGDLHDYEYNETCIGLYLAGDIQADADNRGKLTYVDETTQTYEFKYDSSVNTYWGGAKGTINFKLCTDATTWKQDFGGKMDIPVFLNLNDDFVTLEPRNAANSNPGNIKVENLIDGKTYKIVVNYDPANLLAKVKIEGEAIDFPTLRVVTKDGQSLNMVREGTTYKYVFTPTEDGKIEYYVTNGYLYYSTEGTIDGEVAGVDVEDDVPSWTTFNYTAGTEWLLQVSTAYDKNAAVTMYAGVNDTTILAKCDVIGGWDGWKVGRKLQKVNEDTYQIDFTASASTFEFAVREKAGSWDTRWFGGIPAGKEKPATAILMDDVEVGGDALTPVYYDKDPGMDGKNIVIKGLSKDSIYTIVIQIKDASKKELAVSCKLKQAVVAQLIDLTGFELAGDLAWIDENTPTGCNLVKDGNNFVYELIYSDSMTGWGGGNGTLNFKVRTAGSWTTGYGSETVVEGTLADGITFADNGGNIQLNGLVDGTTYILTFTPSTSDITLSVAPKA